MNSTKLDPESLGKLQQATTFLNYEADLLDRHAFHDWLELWDCSGRYIVPIERDTSDFENSLNYIFDDHDMRTQRITRLMSGHALSASPVMRTVRTISRVRFLDLQESQWLVSSALMIVSYKRQIQTLIVGDVTHKLDILPQGIRILEKIVRLINSDDPMPELSFLP